MTIEKVKKVNNSEINFYSLFYLNEREEEFANLRVAREKALKTYMACASVQATLMRQLGAFYEVITNSADEFSSKNQRRESGVNYRVLEFDRDVPFDIPFRSAHFKLDVIKAFGRGKLSDRPALIDLDLVAVAEIPFEYLRKHELLVYDITDQMIADIGRDRLISDLSFLLGRPIDVPVWYGGEFISGSSEAFSALSEQIERLWPRYRDNVDRFAHIGDETIVTAAVCELVKAGFEIEELGSANVVTRWWSARTTFPQKSLSNIKDIPFWHLPSDKDFIAKLDGVEFHVSELRSRYAADVAPRLNIRRSFNGLLNFIRNENKYVSSVK